MRRIVMLVLGVLACHRPEATSHERPAQASVDVPTSASGKGALEAKASLPHVGRWRGRYRAAKGQVELPAGVDEKSWMPRDDGSAFAGDGEVVLDVGEDGDALGSLAGSLGDLTVRGRFEDGMLRAGVMASSPGSDSVSGMLIGVLRGVKLEAELRVANQDAALVRVASIALEKD